MHGWNRLLTAALAGLMTLSLASGCGTPGGVSSGLSARGTVAAHAASQSRFPKTFMWGVATAGFQYEGGDTTSNWAVWERTGRTKHPIGVAIDHWNRYQEDLDLAKGLGLSAYRLSLEWARLEPSPGKIDPAAVKHYHDVLDAIRARGMEPIVTVSHWAYPAWLDEPDAEGRRGWDSDRMVTELTRHSAWVAKEYGPQVRWWLTLNEPNTMGAASYVVGIHAPGRHSLLAYQRVMNHQVEAHKAAYEAIHANDADAQVSLCPIAIHHPDIKKAFSSLSGFYLTEVDVFDRLTPRWSGGKEKPLADKKRYLDFMGYNFFHAPRLRDIPNLTSYGSWPIRPEGMYEVSKKLFERYRLPLMITENGMATMNDNPRKDSWNREAFIVNHLAHLERAMADGIPVLGYMHWSLVDNYEWGSYQERLGLYGIDRRDPTLRRFRTSAADVYEAIVKANGIPADLRTRYWGKTH